MCVCGGVEVCGVGIREELGEGYVVVCRTAAVEKGIGVGCQQLDASYGAPLTCDTGRPVLDRKLRRRQPVPRV